jgi:hypothetical protein
MRPLAARQSILSPRQTRHSVTKAVDKIIVEFKESHWRWTFWLVLVALLIERVLRVPTPILQIGLVLPTDFPAWYVMLQALIGVVQVAIGRLMAVGYRRVGVGKLLRGVIMGGCILAQANL